MTTVRISEDLMLTTEHPQSSYGRPVLVRDGIAYAASEIVDRPGDLDIFGEPLEIRAWDLVKGWLSKQNLALYDGRTDEEVARLKEQREDLQLALRFRADYRRAMEMTPDA